MLPHWSLTTTRRWGEGEPWAKSSSWMCHLTEVENYSRKTETHQSWHIQQQNTKGVYKYQTHKYIICLINSKILSSGSISPSLTLVTDWISIMPIHAFIRPHVYLLYYEEVMVSHCITIVLTLLVHKNHQKTSPILTLIPPQSPIWSDPDLPINNKLWNLGKTK